MEDIVPADSGEVVLMKLNYQRALQLEGEALWAVCYCIMKRAGGFLLALPPAYIPQPVLEEASREGFIGILGPYVLTTSPAVELSETGEWVGVYPARDVSVLVADFREEAAAGVEILDEGLGDCVPFAEETTNLFPLATHLVAFSNTWAAGVEGERGAGYYTAEEQAPPGTPLGRRPKPSGEAKRRPTVAALAAQQSEIVQALQALSTQVQTLAKAGQVREPPPPPAAGHPRPALSVPVSAAIAPSPAGARAIADMLGAPPRGRTLDMPAPIPGLDGLPLDALGEEVATDEPNSIASAVLAQSKALTALVAQISGSDPLSDLASGSASSLSTKGSAGRLRLQRELASRSGIFFDKVYEAAVRRMEPTIELHSFAGGVHQPAVMTRYLERYGGFRDHRVWGLVQWQLAQIFDLLTTDQVGGAKDALALLMVMVDQLVLDAGSPELGWILTLQPDPPNPLFSAPSNMPGSSLRPCSHLADPKWVATSLAFVKEMETLQNRRAEVAKRPPPVPPEPGGPSFSGQVFPSISGFGMLRSWSQGDSFYSSFAKSGTGQGVDSCQIGPRGRHLLIERVLYVSVLALNFLHSDFRLRSMLKACSERGSHPLAAGRRGPHLIARLRELNSHLASLGLSTFPYARSEKLSGFVAHCPEGPESLHPYRDADPARLKISGDGAWNIQEHLGPELRLPFLEPQVLRSIPENSLPYPRADEEDPQRSLQLLKLWDRKGLLFLSFEKKGPKDLTRVFGAFKSEAADRMIGDRRGANACEGRVLGPSKFSPPGHLLTQLTVPQGCRIIGASTDRADFYHQARISASKAEGNAVGPPFPLRDFEGTGALQKARALARAVARGPSGPSLPARLEEARLVSSQVPASLLFEPSTYVRGAFRSLFQGDHAGVEFATEGHSNLLLDHGLLEPSGRLLARHAPSREGPWQGLIIDDFFSLSVEPLGACPTASAAALLVSRARECYDAAGVAGSPHKDINGADFFTAAGAQVNATATPLADGRVLVSAPTPKVLSLAIISLQAARLPAISEELASNLAGSWISVLMFRRCLFSVLDTFFALGKAEATTAAGSKLRPLRRKEAQELVILASLAPFAASNIAAEFCDRIFCSDSSMFKGAVCVSHVRPEVAASIWLSTDKKGCYTRLEPCPAPESQAAVLDEDHEVPEGLSSASRPFAFDFDVLCICAGSRGVAESCKRKGLRVSPIIDLSTSPEFDLTRAHVLEWIFHLLWSGRARSLVITLPSAAVADFRRGSAPPQGLPAFVKSCFGVFKVAVRAKVPGFLFFKKGSGVLASPQAQGLLKAHGCRLVPPAVDQADPSGSPGLCYVEGPLPPFLFVSRRASGEACHGTAQCLKEVLCQLGPRDAGLPSGFESVAINDVLITSHWKTAAVWSWDRQKHINYYETESTITAMRMLAREGKDCRATFIADSSCARGALAKGRSSAKLLRPSLRRSAAIAVSAGIFPAFSFGPTRHNVSDDPTRDVPLREPAPLSVLTGLEESDIVGLCELSGANKLRARWLRLCFLAASPGRERASLVSALRAFPDRSCPPVPPAGLFPQPLPAGPDHPAEAFASVLLSQGKFEPFGLGELLDLLPASDRSRFSGPGCSKAWTTGLFIHGPHCGLRRNFSIFPAATSLVCRSVLAVAKNYAFTTVSLLEEVKSSPHRDVNNLPGWPNLVFPISSFTGGEIWCEGGAATTPLTIDGSLHYGELLEVSRGPVWLDGSRLHCTLPWQGTRKVAVAFAIRDIERLDTRSRRRAAAAGFPLPRRNGRWTAAGQANDVLDFDSTLGFPGEGTLLTSHELLGFTLDSLLAAKPLDPELVADWVICYGKDLYGSGRPYYHYSETINALTAAKPILRRQMQAAWDLGFSWLAEEPSTHHTAVPPIVLVSLLAACLAWGWLREAGCFALAFGGVMRIGEIIQSRRENLILPEDVMHTQQFILVSIKEPKTRNRGPKHQSAKVEAADLVQVVVLAFSSLTSEQKLWPFSPQTLRKRLDTLLLRTGAAPCPKGTRPLDLGSFRAGGATYLLQQTEDSELVRRRGRWASAKVMEIYLQEISSATYLPALPRGQKSKVAAIAAGFAELLQQATRWKSQGIESKLWYRLWPGGMSTHGW
ncbi:unnamed protein product [Symbiodinium sp. CCMP2456]|nr:unnamed protein product [Symbiodinium sp. CCMP2456]